MEQKIFIASDHRGIEYKHDLCKYIQESKQNMKIDVIDLGPHNNVSVNYVDFAIQVVHNMLSSTGSYGVLLCGTGIGMSIAANRHTSIRAALCCNVEMAKMSRMHNDANVLCAGVTLINQNMLCNMFDAFINTQFEGGRHSERVQSLSTASVKIDIHQ